MTSVARGGEEERELRACVCPRDEVISVIILRGLFYFDGLVFWCGRRDVHLGRREVVERKNRGKKRMKGKQNNSQGKRNNIGGYLSRSWFLTSGSMAQNIQLKAAIPASEQVGESQANPV